MNEYPNWVIDLVMAVDEHEETHPAPGRQRLVDGESPVTATRSDCLIEAYRKIPDSVVQGARIARQYVKNMAGESA